MRYLYGNPGLTATKTANNVAIEGANCLYDNRSYGLNPALGFPVMFTTTDLAA